MLYRHLNSFPVSIWVGASYWPLPLVLQPHSDRKIRNFLLYTLSDKTLTRDLAVNYSLTSLDILVLKGAMYKYLPLEKNLFDKKLVSEVFWRTQLLLRSQLREAGFNCDPLVEPCDLWKGPPSWKRDEWEKHVAKVVTWGYQPGTGV